jgi:hypothetical protein
MPQLLATMEDFAAARGVTFDPTDLQALIALEGASGIVRAYCNREFAYVEDDEVTVFPRGTVGLLLPEVPVHEVSAVTLVDSDGTETDLELGDWFLDGASGILYRVSTTGAYPWYWGWHWYHLPTLRVVLTYSHGYILPGEAEIDGVPDLPAELSLAVISIASRNITTAASGGQSVRSKTVGSYTVTYGDTQTLVDELGITAAERQVLDRHRLQATP